MYETTWTVMGHDISLSSEYIGGEPAPWHAPGGNDNLNYIYASTDGRTEEVFKAWGSVVEPQFDTEYALKNIFQCICDDALHALWEDWDELTDGLSYSEGTRLVEACRETLDKLDNISLGEEDILLAIVNDEEWQ